MLLDGHCNFWLGNIPATAQPGYISSIFAFTLLFSVSGLKAISENGYDS